jgi:hypothetical protein
MPNTSAGFLGASIPTPAGQILDQCRDRMTAQVEVLKVAQDGEVFVS